MLNDEEHPLATANLLRVTDGYRVSVYLGSPPETPLAQHMFVSTIGEARKLANSVAREAGIDLGRLEVRELEQ